jgi:hypothetical protein
MAWTVALAFRRIAVRRSYDRCVQLLGARYDFIEIGHFAEPQQDSIPNLEIWADEDSMVVFNIAMMELKDERLTREQPFVVWAAMITTQAKELLIPAARCLDIAYGDHGLRLSHTYLSHNAEPVAGRIIDLGKPPLTAIESRAAAHFAAIGLDLPEYAVEAVSRDPQNRTAGGRRDIGCQLTDQSGTLKTSAVGVNGPAEDPCVKGSRTLNVESWKLQVFDLPMRRQMLFAHACSIDYGYSLVNLSRSPERTLDWFQNRHWNGSTCSLCILRHTRCLGQDDVVPGFVALHTDQLVRPYPQRLRSQLDVSSLRLAQVAEPVRVTRCP